METLSPKARFDALANLLQLDSAAVDAVRNSIKPLLPNVNDLIRRLNEMMQKPDFAVLFGEVSRDRMQSLLASFIMRTINCNFDEAYCNYAHEVSRGEDVPAGMFALGLSLANDFVAETLPAHIEERDQLATMLAAWNRLTAVLKELTRQ